MHYTGTMHRYDNVVAITDRRIQFTCRCYCTGCHHKEHQCYDSPSFWQGISILKKHCLIFLSTFSNCQFDYLDRESKSADCTRTPLRECPKGIPWVSPWSQSYGWGPFDLLVLFYHALPHTHPALKWPQIPPRLRIRQTRNHPKPAENRITEAIFPPENCLT